MKKLWLVLTVALGVFSLSGIAAQAEQLDRKVFAGRGTFQRWVNFSFTVPAGNCGNLQVYEFIRGTDFLGIAPKWELRSPGEVTPGYGGFFRFVNEEAECASRFSISGNLNEVQQIETAMMVEIEPAEVGMFAEGIWEPQNFFQLSEDDAAYSYDLLMPAWGVDLSLDALLKDELYGTMAYQRLVGVIISDSRGFLKKKVFGRKIIEREAEKIWLRSDDIIVLAYRER